MRLRSLAEEYGSRLRLEWRAFPLRPEPVAGVPFRGTRREEGWRRCGAMSAADGISFTPWPHDVLPGWSLPALDAAKCAALQGADLFGRLQLALFRAYFGESRDIADPAEVRRVAAEAGGDMDRFDADLASGAPRRAVLADYREAIERGVHAIPTVMVEGAGRPLVGLADLDAYRALVTAVAPA